MPVSVKIKKISASQFIIAACRSIVDCSSDNYIPYPYPDLYAQL